MTEHRAPVFLISRRRSVVCGPFPMNAKLSRRFFLVLLFSAGTLPAREPIAPPPAQQTVRARALGIPFDGTPGPLNAITDVAGVTVGYTTLISGEGKLEVGKGPMR